MQSIGGIENARQRARMGKPSSHPMNDDEAADEGTRPKRHAATPNVPATVDPDEELTRSMRPSTGPLLQAVLLNGGLALILLGGPFLRGVLRAEASVAAYGRFAACMTGGTPEAGLGLALPDGDRAAFAATYRSGDATWPARCLPDLDAIAQEDAIFLMPGAKEHEADVRSMVTLLRGELERLEVSVDGDVPATPLAAMGRLQGALTELSAATLARVTPEAPAIALPSFEPVIASRLPLTVPEGGLTELRFTSEGIDVISADARRLAVLRVRGATVHEEHERRANEAHAVYVDPAAHATLLFTTREEVCEADADGCARRMTGLAATDGTAVTERRAERWVGGHLDGRADRSVWIEGSRMYLIARADDGGREVRGFDFDAPEPEAVAPNDVPEAETPPPVGEEDAPRHRARSRLPLGTPRDALLHVRQGSAEVLFLEGATLRRAALAGDATSELALTLPARRLHACGSFVVASAPEGLEVLVQEPALRSLGLLSMPIRAPLSASSEMEEPVQVACDANTLLIGVIHPGPTADVIACDGTACRTLDVGTRAVHGLDVAVADATLWIAEWGGDGHHQVVLRRARVGPIGGIALSEPLPLPACWSDHHGFCAPATFSSDGTHLALFTRELTDALVVALEDGALRGLPGLR